MGSPLCAPWLAGASGLCGRQSYFVDENREQAHRFLDKVPVNYPILYDPESSVSELYEVQAMPTTVMIDRNGNARYLHYGYQPGYEDDYEQQIRELVRE